MLEYYIYPGNNSILLYETIKAIHRMDRSYICKYGANQMYSKLVEEHFSNPRNVGTLDKKNPNVGAGLVGAPACGDVMSLTILVENDIIIDAKFKTFGCGSAIAASSLVTEWIKGMSLDEAYKIKNTQIAEELILPVVKMHCSGLAQDSVQAAILDYKNKQKIIEQKE